MDGMQSPASESFDKHPPGQDHDVSATAEERSTMAEKRDGQDCQGHDHHVDQHRSDIDDVAKGHARHENNKHHEASSPGPSVSTNALCTEETDLACRSLPHSFMLSLPVELLLEVFSNFDDPKDMHPARDHWKELYVARHDEDRRQTVRSVRLVCRLFNQLASRFLFSGLELDISQASLDFVDRLSRRPHLAKGIRHIELFLYYRPFEIAEDIIRFQDERQSSLQEFHAACKSRLAHVEAGNDPTTEEPLRRAVENYEKVLEAWDPGLDEDCHGMLPRELLTYHQCLYQGFRDYRQKHKEQLRLISEGHFTKNLATSLARMRYNGSLLFTDEPSGHPEPLSHDATLVLSGADTLRRFMATPLAWWEHQFLHVYSPLVPATILWDLPIAMYKAGAALQSLTIDTLPMQDLYMLEPGLMDPWGVSWDDLHVALGSLQRSKSERCVEDAILSEHIPPDEREFLDKFLSATLSSPNLREIDVCLPRLSVAPEWSSGRKKDYYPFGHVLRSISLQHVVKLSMAYISLDQNDLEAICRGLGPSVVFFCVTRVGLTKGAWSPALDLLRKKYVAKCSEGQCELIFTEMTGGEFEWSHIKAIDSSPSARHRWKSWDFYEGDTIVGQLVGRYVDGTGVMENPLTGDIEQILLDGPQELEGEETTPSSSEM